MNEFFKVYKFICSSIVGSHNSRKPGPNVPNDKSGPAREKERASFDFSFCCLGTQNKICTEE